MRTCRPEVRAKRGRQPEGRARKASVVASIVLGLVLAPFACQENARIEVPPVTSAMPAPTPILGNTTAPSAADASVLAIDHDASAVAVPKEPPAKVFFVDVPGKVDAEPCMHVLVAVAKGSAKTMGETLAAGDVLSITYPDPLDLAGAGLVVVATERHPECKLLDKPAPIKKVIRAKEAPELKFAGGAMIAHLDVGPKVSPTLYLGRLEGTSAVPEHTHPTSWEIVAAIEANGTFVLDGTEGKLGPKQVVMVPPGAKHAWKPDPGSKLVAFQLYSPPGPEQRFAALAAAEKDAGASAVAADAGPKK